MADIGKKIAEYYGKLSEAEKARYSEISQKQKEVFDVAFAEYKKNGELRQILR